MFREEYLTMCGSGIKKWDLLRSTPMAYLIASMVAGMFISFGSFVSMTIGGFATAAGSTSTKFLVSFTFAAALSLVIAAGSELFTGNNMVLAAASLNRDVAWRNTLLLWVVCYAGNLIGSWILVLIFQATGLTAANEAVAQFFASTAEAKIHQSALALFTKGILCNICVCLAVWCGIKLKNEAARLIMVTWCILIFMICSFEHSFANMSIIGVGLLNPCGLDITVPGYLRNLLFVSLGNIVGGAFFVALPYYLISRERTPAAPNP